MKNLRFIPYTYRQQTIVKVALAFDRELMRTLAHKRTTPMPHYALKKSNSISSHSYFFKIRQLNLMACTIAKFC